MLRDLFDAFRKDSLMSTIINEFSLMMEDARWMFETIGRALLEASDPEPNAQQIYDRDIRVNKAERSIRKKIIEHLTLHPGKDLGTSLVLFSAAKDAERLGDYCKNLLEVAGFLDGQPLPASMAERVAQLHTTISGLFTRTALTLAEAKTEEAQKIMETVREVSRECDTIVKEIMNGPDDQDVKSAVATTLIVRYFKRVAAHISNIASGVVNPVHKIDFYDASSSDD